MARVQWVDAMTLDGWRAAAACALGFALVAMGSIACGGADAPLLCGEIPPGGCPIGRGGTCADPTCTGLYDCVSGHWRETMACPHPQGQGGAGSSSSANSSSSGQCTGAMLDHTKQTVGCTPDLEAPDCNSDVAETCHPCTTGCIDFFMCEAQGWMTVAYCDGSGKLILKP
jgi:hypothetical protein